MINTTVIGEYKIMDILAICQKVKILWHFKILTWEAMGNLKCGITQKRLIVEQNERKFGTQGTTVHICRVPLMPDSLSLVWGHSVHFAKFPIFLKLGSSSNFHPIHPNFVTTLATMVNLNAC